MSREINRATVALGLAVAVASTLLAGTALKANEHNTASKVDKTTLCLVNQPLTKHTHLIVDKTDFYTPDQLLFLHYEILKIKDSLEQNELFTFSFLTSRTSGFRKIKSIFKSCAPPKEGEVNMLYENPRMIRQKFEKNFEAPFQVVLSELQKNEEYKTSPIIETFEAVTDLKGFTSDEIKSRLIIFSDGLNNTKELNHYLGTKQTTPSTPPAFKFRNTTVDFYYLIRPATAHLQTKKNQQFWVNFLKRVGVSNPNLTVLKRF